MTGFRHRFMDGSPASSVSDVLICTCTSMLLTGDWEAERRILWQNTSFLLHRPTSWWYDLVCNVRQMCSTITKGLLVPLHLCSSYKPAITHNLWDGQLLVWVYFPEIFPVSVQLKGSTKRSRQVCLLPPSSVETSHIAALITQSPHVTVR